MKVNNILLSGMLLFHSMLLAQQNFKPTLADNPYKTTKISQQKSLSDVLHELEKQYAVTISYQSVLLEGKFISYNKINKDWSLEKQLDSILLPFKLHYNKVTATHYVILKQHIDERSSEKSISKITPVLTEKTIDRTISGVVRSATQKEPLSGASIQVKRKNKGTTADAHGRFTVSAEMGDVLMVSMVGYEQAEILVSESNELIVDLNPIAGSLGQVTIVGSRSRIIRTSTQTPVAMDMVSEKELLATGNADVSQMVNVVIPSFNSARQTISNGTDHIDPATLRGLGPDQVLVLINGKRRHNSALVNVNSTVGRGAVGTDMNSISASAIQRIEVLRDGAAAQYGSDAIAGVINIVLKDKVKQFDITGKAGKTKEGDGENIQLGANYGLPVGNKGGFINLSAEYRHREPTNRVGTYNNTVYLPLLPQTRYPGLPNYIPLTQAEINRQRQDDSMVVARGYNKANTMILGNSKAINAGMFANMKIPISQTATYYMFGGYNFRYGKASGFHRFPNATRTNNLTIYPNGYTPFIITHIKDKSIATGYTKEFKNEWEMDISGVYGGNSIQFDITNSLNASMGNASPTEAYAGTLKFNQATFDLTFTRDFGKKMNLRSFNLAFGTEYRLDNYQIEKGEEASYKDGNPPNTPAAQVKASGIQVFGGFRPSNEVNENRSNIGVFADLETDLSKKLLIGAALRFENYSDFGSNLSGKLVSRFKINNVLALRAGINRGFRAPSLHQKYYSAVSTQFITVNGVNTQREVFTVNNSSPVVDALGIPELKPELSWSYSAGITASYKKFALTIDGYRIDIKDRIVVSGRFSKSIPQVAPLLQPFPDVTEVQFFNNAINTRTVGLDIIATQKINLNKNNTIALNVSANFNQTDIIGDSAGVKTSQQLSGLGETMLNREERGRIEVNQPKSKMIFNANYAFKTVLGFNLRFTRYGEISAIAPQDKRQDQTFSAKLLTDVLFNWNITRNITWNLGVNNLFDIYPDEVADPRLTNDGTVIYSRFATQFGFNGMNYFTGFNLKF